MVAALVQGLGLSVLVWAALAVVSFASDIPLLHWFHPSCHVWTSKLLPLLAL